MTTMPTGTTREQYADAVTLAMVWEDDWTTLALFYDAAELNQKRREYWASCRAGLIERFGWAPWPFDEEPRE